MHLDIHENNERIFMFTMPKGTLIGVYWKPPNVHAIVCDLEYQPRAPKRNIQYKGREMKEADVKGVIWRT